ncbi:SusE outer membrane protein [Flaviramulus basaltis]|uniref:SusE outer membrane protein n=2 Tax=Flaviramulus basaltis TaxID=369401 RepID=A0A1K2ITY9_9FLAO|nr:SusE domain-containing protein [Flaviramulus basaltis]SFZ95203.1 SusE outer membrane protein [Flaviramulus basaltis]
MKKIKILAVLLISILSFISCEDDTSLEYIAQPQGEFTFSNSFLSEYVLIPAASNNIGERFTWDAADFGTPTNITYELQSSMTADFAEMQVVGTTSDNEYAVTIGTLLQYATQAGLDNDPATENPNTGSIYFRLRAFAGTDSDTETLTSTQALTVTLPENTGNNTGPVCDSDYLWAVGAGLPDAGWGWDTPVSLSCQGDGVYGWNVNLQNNGGADNNFRFFTSEGDWGSGQNYPYFIGEGYTIDANFADAADGDNNFAFIGTTGYYYLEVDTVNKTITVSDPQATGVCEFDQLWAVGAGLPDAGWDWATPVKFLCTGEGVYSGSANFANDTFRFFTTEGDWATGQNYPYYITEGYTIDANFEDAADGDNNFRFLGTPGTYFLTIDTVTKTITLE